MGIKNIVTLASGLIEVENEAGTRMQFHPDHLTAKVETKPEELLGQVREFYEREVGKAAEKAVGEAPQKGKKT